VDSASGVVYKECMAETQEGVSSESRIKRLGEVPEDFSFSAQQRPAVLKSPSESQAVRGMYERNLGIEDPKTPVEFDWFKDKLVNPKTESMTREEKEREDAFDRLMDWCVLALDRVKGAAYEDFVQSRKAQGNPLNRNDNTTILVSYYGGKTLELSQDLEAAISADIRRVPEDRLDKKLGEIAGLYNLAKESLGWKRIVKGVGFQAEYGRGGKPTVNVDARDALPGVMMLTLMTMLDRRYGGKPGLEFNVLDDADQATRLLQANLR